MLMFDVEVHVTGCRWSMRSCIVVLPTRSNGHLSTRAVSVTLRKLLKLRIIAAACTHARRLPPSLSIITRISSLITTHLASSVVCILIHGWFSTSLRSIRLLGSLMSSLVIRSRASDRMCDGNFISTFAIFL